jgi:hypothetical protein
MKYFTWRSQILSDQLDADRVLGHAFDFCEKISADFQNSRLRPVKPDLAPVLEDARRLDEQVARLVRPLLLDADEKVEVFGRRLAPGIEVSA